MSKVHVPLYKVTLLIRNSAPLGPYSRAVARVPWWSWIETYLLGGWRFL